MNSFQNFSLNEIQIATITTESLKEYLSMNLLDEGENNLIVTFNLDFLHNSYIDKKFKTICQNAKLVVPDGVGITSLVYFKYNKIIRRITGTDVFNTILSIAEEKHLKISLVGSSTSAHEKITKKLNEEFPHIKIVSALSPPLQFEKNEEENKKVLDELIMSKPDVLFVALGSPRQEYWIEQNKKAIGAKLNVGVGAVFNYFSGEKIRAPKIFQSVGLEWLWRLMSEPKRLFKRYILNDIPFYFKMLGQILTRDKWN